MLAYKLTAYTVQKHKHYLLMHMLLVHITDDTNNTNIYIFSCKPETITSLGNHRQSNHHAEGDNTQATLK